MDLERLGLCASAVAQFFTGTGIASDRATLAKLGTGRLELDLLNATCRYRGEEVPPLAVFALLRNRLEQGLGALNVRLEDVGRAVFIADLWFGNRSEPPALMSMDAPRAMVTCMAFTQCEIHFGEYQIAAHWADQLEWPAARAA